MKILYKINKHMLVAFNAIILIGVYGFLFINPILFLGIYFSISTLYYIKIKNKTTENTILYSFLWVFDLLSQFNSFIKDKIIIDKIIEGELIVVQYMDQSIKYLLNGKLHNESKEAFIPPFKSNRKCEYWLYGNQIFPKNHEDFLKTVKEEKIKYNIKNKVQDF